VNQTDHDALIRDINRAIQVTIIAIVVLAFTAWACGSDNRTDRGRVERVDLIELNHFYSHCASKVFSQVIFWDVDPATRKLHARGYRLVNTDEDLPIKNELNGEYETRFIRTYRDQQSVSWKIRSNMFRESWIQIDPERDDFRVWPDRMLLMSLKESLP